jgi:Ser/Thr protein kinase RdoA (MazF antagonist)
MADNGEQPAAGEIVRGVLAAFGLGAPCEVWPLGGTASPKWGVMANGQRWVVRVRPAEFADDASVRFDHQILRQLRSAGFPVPDPQARSDGSTVLEVVGGRVCEVLRWLDGEPFPDGNCDALRALGTFLARWHQTLAGELPGNTAEAVPKKRNALREDHPQLMERYLAALGELATNPSDRRQLEQLALQLDRVGSELDAGLYQCLPQTIIHGDLHPGNLRFRQTQVAAVYDFDYLSVQARARDVSDAIMFFASRREGTTDYNDIRSLTRPLEPDLRLCQSLLEGYCGVAPLESDEWEALPQLIRSRWLQIRLRGARKVPQNEKLRFVLDEFFVVIDWLDREADDFFEELRQA